MLELLNSILEANLIQILISLYSAFREKTSMKLLLKKDPNTLLINLKLEQRSWRILKNISKKTSPIWWKALNLKITQMDPIASINLGHQVSVANLSKPSVLWSWRRKLTHQPPINLKPKYLKPLSLRISLKTIVLAVMLILKIWSVPLFVMKLEMFYLKCQISPKNLLNLKSNQTLNPNLIFWKTFLTNTAHKKLQELLELIK